MKAFATTKRRFLFLQGPPGPFFWLLGKELEKRGCAVFRINFNGGDRHDWPGEAVNYRGRASRWPMFFDHFIRNNRITDIMMFGDCRPLHHAAHGLAKLRDVTMHVFEEGYIRPHWVTMEPDGVNGYSAMYPDAERLIQQAHRLPPIPPVVPISASFERRARDALHYYASDCLTRWQYPFYKSHRPGSLLLEGLGWLLKFGRQRWNAPRNAEELAHLDDAPYFLFPLQLGTDYQIRTHSPFGSMREAAIYVMESFALNAPPNTNLVIKEHPLDCDFRSWRDFVRRQARRLGMEGRFLHVDGGDLEAMAHDCLGMVTVNSTSGTLGLANGAPVFVMGHAVYNVPGITHQGRLDDFWGAPLPPEKAKYDAFRRVLHARCLVSGGFASQSAIATLIESTLIRLFEDPAHIPLRLERSMGRFLGSDQASAAAGASVAASVGASRIR